MSFGEMAFLALVLTAFITFIVSLLFLSIWTRSARRGPSSADSKHATTDSPQFQKAA
jgi:uncharacterized membrane protein YeiB